MTARDLGFGCSGAVLGSVCFVFTIGKGGCRAGTPTVKTTRGTIRALCASEVPHLYFVAGFCRWPRLQINLEVTLLHEVKKMRSEEHTVVACSHVRSDWWSIIYPGPETASLTHTVSACVSTSWLLVNLILACDLEKCHSSFSRIDFILPYLTACHARPPRCFWPSHFFP